MSNYSGLDENLISTESPEVDVVSSYDYNSRNDRNNVTSYNIQELNAGKINSGTITVGTGGTVAGLLRVLDSSGGTIVTADSNGLTVNNGSITVKNTSGTTIIDSLGLNTVNNFYNDRVTGGTFNTTSTTPVSITGGTLSTFVLERATNILIYISINGRNFDADSALGAVVYDTYSGGTISNLIANVKGATDFYTDGSGHITSSFLYNELATVVRNLTFAAGTHTLNLQSYIRLGTAGTASLQGWELGIVKLGN